MTSTVSATPASTLRKRLIEDINLHRLSRATQRNYLRNVSRFATWLGRPPDTAGDEDLHRYQIEQTETGFGAPAMNTAVSVLRFLRTRTLDRSDLTRKLHRVKHPRALPTVLSREEVTRMLDATTSIQHQAILSVAYGAGLRDSEVTKRVGPHILRHSFTTHLLEDGVDIRIIQVLLRHAQLTTTSLYTRVATRTVKAEVSPLDRLGMLPGPQGSAARLSW